MGEALHSRRVEILRYLAGRASVEGPPPSVREIGAAVGLSSSQTVHHHLGRLEEEGYVTRVGRGARTFGLTGKGCEAAGRMALLGRIAAGREELWAAREYVSGSGPFDGAPAKRMDRVLDEFEGYYVRREIWLNRETLGRLHSFALTLRAYQRELASLPLYYEDPDFEREHERVGRELDRWLKTDLPAAREGLTDAFRGMLGVGRWRRGVLR